MCLYWKFALQKYSEKFEGSDNIKIFSGCSFICSVMPAYLFSLKPLVFQKQRNNEIMKRAVVAKEEGIWVGMSLRILVCSKSQ